MRYTIINILRSIIEQNKMQTRLNILIGKNKKADYIKIKIPKKYIVMIELLAKYGINNNIQLLKILSKARKK